jgi:hypothetical protein
MELGKTQHTYPAWFCETQVKPSQNKTLNRNVEGTKKLGY